MPVLVTVSGPFAGRRWLCQGPRLIIGRDLNCPIRLEQQPVSRIHAELFLHDGDYWVRDRDSLDGTHLNGQRLTQPARLSDGDQLCIGPYVLTIEGQPPAPTGPRPPSEPETIVQHEVEARVANTGLFDHDARQRFQHFLEAVTGLPRSPDLRHVLDGLLRQLFRLFPAADRGIVVLCDGDALEVKARRTRRQSRLALAAAPPTDPDPQALFSRSIVRLVLQKRVGQLCEDVSQAPDLLGKSVQGRLRSFLCVPLLGLDGEALGVLQLDCVRADKAFTQEDLLLLTALGLHAAGLIEGARLHAQRVRQEVHRSELERAREIQEAFLPRGFDRLGRGRYELFATVAPARGVAGDLYDFHERPDGRLAFFLGDVSGKGLASALYMIAVRTLTRALAPSASGAVDMLVRLNDALVADNPTVELAVQMHVTMAHGWYDPRSGGVELVSGGHPLPLLRRTSGAVEEVPIEGSAMLGFERFDTPPVPTRLVLHPGETLVLYSDGLTEARAPDGTMFDPERLMETVAAVPLPLSLSQWAQRITARVQEFSGTSELHDDQTLLLLRRLV